MTEAEWLRSTNPVIMLLSLQRPRSRDPAGSAHRKARLFACACARMVWPYLSDERSREAVQAAERYADGLASEFQRARASAAGRWDHKGNAPRAAWFTTDRDAWQAAR